MPEPMEAYQWLLFFDRSHLSEATCMWVNQIEDLLNQKQATTRIRRLVERLLAVRDTCSDVFEKAEVNIKCALAFYRLGLLTEAIPLLVEAEQLYQPHLHYTAVVLWMEGCIQWKLPDMHEQACINWTRSQRNFEKLCKWSTNPDHILWYNERVWEIRDQMITQVGEENAGTAPQPEAKEKNNDDNEPAPEPGVGMETLLQLFRVVEKVPAGGFGPVGYDTVTIGAIEINQVLINGKTHRISSLRGAERVIRLPANRYVVVEVTGDSMNNPPARIKSAGINKGDYVLLLEQNNAQNGDIVAAEIDNEDSCATLKRFKVDKTGARYILVPESTNQAYQPREFTHLDEGFHIRGIALAVFKPV